ncbi:MAG: T9SS type A sorting domain-containing protein [candidate division KSB1 bacterium]|nr:T9SS type A sorting domain-containing protein [candidate division KSB1 bacterium]MDZ7342731.1 T9SS type A sorting domain-containing protein [candidate division KSB1 bacterium]
MSKAKKSFLMVIILVALILAGQSVGLLAQSAEKGIPTLRPTNPATALISAISDQELAVTLTLPDTVAAPNRYMQLPLFISGVDNFDIISALIEIQFDSSRLSPLEVSSEGTLTTNWPPPVVHSTGSSWLMALAGPQPLASDGVLVYLRFRVKLDVAENDSCTLTFSQAILNEGNPLAATHDGAIHIRGLQLAGAVIYQGTAVPVPKTRLQLFGQVPSSFVTNENGNYNFMQLPVGDMTLRPTKLGEQGKCISPFDAALVLQYAVGINQLSPYQLIAADVSGDSTVTSFDASLIMRYAVKLEKKFPVMADSLDFWDFIPKKFPVDNSNWYSHPDSLRYAPLASDQFGQDFIGIVAGDVSQNWAPAATPAPGLRKAALLTTARIGEIETDHSELVRVPIELVDAVDVIAVEIDLQYPLSNVRPIAVRTTDWSTGFLLNYAYDGGRMKIGMAAATPLSGSGRLVEIEFSSQSAIPEFRDGLQIIEVAANDQPLRITAVAERNNPTAMPEMLQLWPNYPNPFNQETVFQFSVPQHQTAVVSLVIYNIRGQQVRMLQNGKMVAGKHQMRWDGKGDNGQLLPSGDYFCVLRAGSERSMQKVVLLR